MNAADALARLKERGTLSDGNRPANALSSGDVNSQVSKAVKRAVIAIGDTQAPRWLAPSTALTVLP